MIKARYQFVDHEVLVVPVLGDNFVYLICRNDLAVLVDAGAAKPVFRILEREKLQLVNVLITHAHRDHDGGCRAIQDRLGVQSTSPGIECREVEMLGTMCRSISTPGHLSVHKCYHFPALGAVFTGDTIINGACGRMMGATAERYFASLAAIKALPDETIVFGGHDYLAENMAFALSVEPDNPAAAARLERYASNPAAALFASLAEEKQTNPFLRARTAAEFAELRAMKDRF